MYFFGVFFGGWIAVGLDCRALLAMTTGREIADCLDCRVGFASSQ